MGYRVVKPFKSLYRKFAAGAAINAADIDPETFLGLDGWIARGFVAADAPAPAAGVPKVSRAAVPVPTE